VRKQSGNLFSNWRRNPVVNISCSKRATVDFDLTIQQQLSSLGLRPLKHLSFVLCIAARKLLGCKSCHAVFFGHLPIFLNDQKKLRQFGHNAILVIKNVRKRKNDRRFRLFQANDRNVSAKRKPQISCMAVAVLNLISVFMIHDNTLSKKSWQARHDKLDLTLANLLLSPCCFESTVINKNTF